MTTLSRYQTARLVINDRIRIVARLRHVDIQNMWRNQEYCAGRLLVDYMPRDQMPAEGFKACRRCDDAESDFGEGGDVGRGV